METLKFLPGEFLFDFSLVDRSLDAERLNDTTLCHHTNGCGGVTQYADISADFL